MANYSFVINSQFKPFSYAELLAPVHASTEAHQKVEDEYTTLSAQAETLRERAAQEAISNPESRWVKKYNDYAAKLEKSASDLASYGLKPGVRQQIREAKKDYFNSVDPAVKAIAQQQKLSDMQYSQNPALRMVYGDMPTIDALIGDMTLKPVAYSGQDVYTQAKTSATAASARNILKDRIERNPKLAGYFNIIKEAGYNAKTIEQMKAIPELADIVELVKGQFNNFKGVNDANKDKLTNEALKGLFDGVVYSKQENIQYDQYGAQMRQFAENAKQRAFQAAEAAKTRAEAAKTRAAAAQRQKANQSAIGGFSKALLNLTGATPDPVKLYDVKKNGKIAVFANKGYLYSKDGKVYASYKSKQDYEKVIKTAKNGGISVKQAIDLCNMNASEANKWIYKNIKDKNKRRILQTAFGEKSISMSNPRIPVDPAAFLSALGSLRTAGQFAGTIDSLYKEAGGNSPLVKYGSGDNQYYAYQPGTIGNLFSGSNRSTTINEHTAWRYKIQETQNDDAIGQLISDLGPGQNSFKKVTYDGSKYVSSGKLDKNALNSTNYRVYSYQASPKGITVELIGKGDKAGEHFFIELPESESKKSLNKILRNNKAYSTIYGVSKDSKDFADFMYKAGISDLYNVFSSMYRTNQAVPQQFKDAGMSLNMQSLMGAFSGMGEDDDTED